MAKFETIVSDYDKRERKVYAKWWTTPPAHWTISNKQEEIPMPDQPKPSEWAMKKAEEVFAAMSRTAWVSEFVGKVGANASDKMRREIIALALDAALAERDEAIRVMAGHAAAERNYAAEAAMLIASHIPSATNLDLMHEAVDRSNSAYKAACLNPIARAAIEREGR